MKHTSDRRIDSHARLESVLRVGLLERRSYLVVESKVIEREVDVDQFCEVTLNSHADL
jgi:hypothetical protein